MLGRELEEDWDASHLAAVLLEDAVSKLGVLTRAGEQHQHGEGTACCFRVLVGIITGHCVSAQ